jgi:hypothetical protein
VGGGHHLEHRFLWLRTENVVAANNNVLETLILPFIRDVARELIVSFGAREVRLGGENAKLSSRLCRRRDSLELLFNLNFLSSRSSGKPEDVLSVRWMSQNGRQTEKTRRAAQGCHLHVSRLPND